MTIIIRTFVMKKKNNYIAAANVSDIFCTIWPVTNYYFRLEVLIFFWEQVVMLLLKQKRLNFTSVVEEVAVVETT